MDKQKHDPKHKGYGTEKRENGDPLTLNNMKIEEEQIFEKYNLGESNILAIVGNKERGYALVLSKHRITDWFKTPAEAEQYIEDNRWHVITIIIGTMIELQKEFTFPNTDHIPDAR